MVCIFLKPLHFRCRIERYGSLQNHKYPQFELKCEVVHGRKVLGKTSSEKSEILNIFKKSNKTPVSYTHLDVYKRQDVRCVSFRRAKRQRMTDFRRSSKINEK